MPENEEPAVAAAVGPPCGACRTLRRRCVPGCVFAPYFTSEDFAAVHGVFGASNVSKMLEGIELPEQRRVAAATLVEEARARARDPTFGRISYLRILQEVNDKARTQVEEAREEIAREFGAVVAYEPVDVAAADPAARMEARAQVDAALKHAREQDARLRSVRKANEVRWREMQLQQQQQEEGTGTGKHAGNVTGPDVVKRHRVSEQTMLMPPGFPDERERQQMAAAEAEREKALLMRQAAPANQNGHHLGAQPGEIEPPRVPEGYAHRQLHQQMSEAQQLTAAAQASRREEAMRSVLAPVTARPQQLDSAGQHAGTGQPRHARDDAAGRTPGQGSRSVLLEAMMQLAGPRDGDEQHLVAQRHAENDDYIAQGMLQLQELLDMAELAKKQKIMKNYVMTEMGQWDAAAGDVMTMMQQIPATTWQHQDPATQYAGMRDGPQEMPQQMEEASTAELAKTTGNMSQQFAWGQQYHDPAAAVHRASPWLQQMAEAQQPAAASASQVASEQDMLLLLQQHQVAAAEELLSASGARQFDNLAAQYDDTELTLGYVYGHPDMHQQQAVAAGQVAGVQDVNSRHAAVAVLAEREMMQLAAVVQHQEHHAQKGLDIALGNGDPDAETQAMFQELAALLELARKEKMIRKQGVATEMGQWDAAAGVTREHDVMTMSQQQDPEASWLQVQEMLEQIEKASSPELDKRLETISRQAEARHAHLEAQELFAMDEISRKREMLMRKIAAAGRARDQEMIAQQQQPVAQYSGTELDITLGNGHTDGSTQGIMQAQELFAMDEITRKREMLMRQIAAAGRARDQEMIAQQAAAAQQQLQQHPAAQYSDILLGQRHGYPYWHQPTVQQTLQEKQLPTVQQMLQEHQPNTISTQQDATYANGEHGGGAGAAMAFLSPGSAKHAPFLVDQQPHPQVQTAAALGLQMDSFLPPLPPSMSQLHAQVSHQQRTDGGGQDLDSDLAAYLHYEPCPGMEWLATAGFSRGSEGSGVEMRQLSEPDAGFASENRVPILRIC